MSGPRGVARGEPDADRQVGTSPGFPGRLAGPPPPRSHAPLGFGTAPTPPPPPALAYGRGRRGRVRRVPRRPTNDQPARQLASHGHHDHPDEERGGGAPPPGLGPRRARARG